MLRHACRLSLEGLVSKQRDAAYPVGRTRSWIKSKCSDRQEFVIAGYVPSSVSKDLVGSLVLGYHKDGKLVHAGRVGTGFSREVARDLVARLEPLRRKTSPFPEKLTADAARGVVWVKPELVAEVEFRAWTADGILRHAAFRGLREDKPAREITREAPAETAPAPKPQVRLTHPDRIYWPDAGVTKQGLADYYAEVWPRMAPFVVNRPVALLRCPGGTEGQCFFQKHAWKGLSREILTFHDPLDDDENPLVAVDGLPGLIGLVQGGALEIHTWQSTLDDLEHPDQIVMDLDPGEGVPWAAVLDAARAVRARFEDAGLAGFVKTSGGKGLHVVAPLKPTDAAGWDAVKGFAAAMARSMADDDPDRYVATITKAKRTGRILLDYLRNGRNNTAIVAYGARARPGAPVSMPLAWDELGPEIGPAHFTVANAPARVANTPDPWADFRAAAAPLADRQALISRPSAGRSGRVCDGSGLALSLALVARDAALQRVHDRDDVAAGRRRASVLRLPAARLLAGDDLLHLLLHRVLEEALAPGLGACVDQLGDEPGQLRLRLRRLREVVVRRPHLVAVAQRPEHDPAAARHQRHRVLAPIEDQPRHRRRPGRHHRLADHREGLLADLVGRLQQVRPVEPDPADVLPRHEPLDVDRPRALEPHRLELLVLEDHEAVVLDLVALRLILLGHRLAGLGIDISALDPVAGLAIDRMKAQRLAWRPRRLHRHWAGDQ